MKIRPYQEKDREELRKLCNDTAFNGLGVELLFTDRDFFADIITKYYTDIEPESTFVAEDKGKIIGYITGCVHPKRNRFHSTLILLRLLPKLIYRFIFRYKKKNRDFIKKMFSTEIPKTPKDALHFHRNVKKGYRGKGIGTKLQHAFYDYAKKATKNRRLCRVFIAFGKGRLKYYEEKNYTIYDSRPVSMFPKKESYIACAFIEDFTKEKHHKR